MLSIRKEWKHKHLVLTLAAVCCTLSLSIISGCGGGGGGSSASPPAAATTTTLPSGTAGQSAAATANSYRLTGDTYGLQNATFLTATEIGARTVLRTAIATSPTDPNFATVFRIDLDQPGGIGAAGTYSLGGVAGALSPFPGTIYFFNGHKSTLLKTVGGTISFSSYGTAAGSTVSGSFQAVIEDGNSPLATKPTYTVSADFTFLLGTSSAVTPGVAPVPAAGVAAYDASCAGCHALGNYDTAAAGAPDLALKGGELNTLFTANTPGHNNITLSAPDLYALKILLNAN